MDTQDRAKIITGYMCWKQDDSLWGMKFYRCGTHKLRCKIRRNAYDSQSWVRVDVWTDASGWAELVKAPIDGFLIKEHSYVHPVFAWDFEMQKDLDVLYEWGKEILSI